MRDLLTVSIAFGFFCLPLLLIWQMVRVRRRLREQDRQRLQQSEPVRPAHIDALSVDADGRMIARLDSFDPALAAADRKGYGADDLKNIEGRR